MDDLFLVFVSRDVKATLTSPKKETDFIQNGPLISEYCALIESIKLSYGDLPNITLLTDYHKDVLGNIFNDVKKIVNTQDVMPDDVKDFIKNSPKNIHGFYGIHKTYFDSISKKGIELDFDCIIFPGFFESIDQNKIFIANTYVPFPEIYRVSRTDKKHVDSKMVWEYLRLTHMVNKLDWLNIAFLYWNNLPKTFSKIVRIVSYEVAKNFNCFKNEAGYSVSSVFHQFPQETLNYVDNPGRGGKVIFRKSKKEITLIHGHGFSGWFRNQPNKKETMKRLCCGEVVN